MMKNPPKWADRFLEWFCKPELLEDLQGDLYELYEEKFADGKARAARYFFIWWVLRSFRLDVIRWSPDNINIGFMTKQNFKIAARVLWRDKFNTLLNVFGLALGLTCFLLMGFYVKQELSFDHMHSKKDRIYRVWVKEDYGGGKIFFNSNTPVIFETVLEEDFPETATAIQYNLSPLTVISGPDTYNENVAVISPEFFDVFDFELSRGNITKPLPDRNSLILSDAYAKKYFGNEDPIGKSMQVQIGENRREFTVSATFTDMPRNSSFQMEMAISNVNNADIYGERALTAWFNVSPETYILLNESSKIEAVEAKVQDVVMTYLDGQVKRGEYNIGFQALTDIHLNPEIPLGIAPVGNPQYVYILGLIGLFVLITAGVNYATLAIGQSLKRRKEVGVRKVLGAMKGIITGQYLSESWLTTLIAMLISIGLAYLTLPLFNELTNAGVQMTFEPWHLLLYLGLVFVVGLLAGIYPALILAGLRIVDILGGTQTPRRAHFIRKSLLDLQFSLTVFLISSTLIMRQQLNFLNSKDLGYQYETTVSVPLYPDPASNSLSSFIGSTMERGQVLKAQLQQYPEISDIGMGSHVFGTPGWGTAAFTDKDNTFRRFRLLVADPDYFNTFNIQAKEGRLFEAENTLDQRESIIINQAAADYFGFQDPLGKQLPGNNFGSHRIIGVTENFNYLSLHSEVAPLVITQNVAAISQGISDHGFSDSPIPKMVFKFTGNQLSDVADLLAQEWPKVFPEEELNFEFVEDNIRAQYESENRMNQMISFATLLAIIVASLGLLGMTVLMINSRIREIGIRKVIGASDFSIFRLLASSFAPQLLIGIILSIPLTYLLMKDWLDNFAYRIPIGVKWFLLSALISVIIALLVISMHTLRAARINPVESIRRN